MDIASLKTPLEPEIWIDGPEGSRFLIRSTESRPYKNRIASLANQNAHRLRKNPTLQQKLAAQAMAETIIVDWEGITDAGEPLPCTEENRLRLVEIPEIRDLIATEAQDLANFRREGVALDSDDLKSGD